MNRSCQLNRRALAVFVAAVFISFSLAAQTDITPVRKTFVSPTNLIPPPQHSPVDFFRQLLAMSPVERKNYLTNRPPEIRARILDKANEYLVLDPNERE